MDFLVQLFIFIAALAVVWYFSGILIRAVDKLARRFNKSGFTVAFFVLGFLTSVSEISVALNATITGAPQVSVGNLVGASFVVLLLIIPLLAIIGNGIKLNDTLTGRNLLIALVVVLLPSLLMIDGNVSRMEGMVTILAYVVLLFAIRNQKRAEVPALDGSIVLGKKPLFFSLAQLLIGAASIFIAGNILVEQSVYFAHALHIPSSLVGLMLLSIGTNLPEIAIAVRAVLQGGQGVAFGGYLGSAVTNTTIFGLLASAHGGFSLSPDSFVLSSLLLTLGLGLFFFCARSKDTISRQEGMALFGVYAVFFCVQLFTVLEFVL